MTLEKLQSDLQTSTIPPGAAVLSSSSLERRQSSALASWDFETTLTWEEYQHWVRARMPGYTATSEGDRLTFAKNLPGDVLRVTIDHTKNTQPIRIHVTWVAAAF
jgi:hypothetical protein